MLTLSQLFGGNAFQNGQILVINKSDLPLLIAFANNSSGALLIAIVLKALENFLDEIKDSDNQPILDSDNKPILSSGELNADLKVFRWRDTLIQRGGLLFIRKTIVLEVYEEYAQI